MYTTTTATRDQVLKAVAATRRVMKRQVCCASFIGRIFTNLSPTKKKKNKQDDEGDLFLLDY